ncbi:Tubulin tyrosine ligase-like 3A [Carabus blaptoides fortunei]
MLLGHQVDFYWDYTTNPFTVNNDKVKRTLINRFPFGATRCYCSKASLCNSLKDSQWYYIEGYANVLAPRTYNLELEDDMQEFIHDFRLTAAISLMKWIDENSIHPQKIVSDKGTIPMSIFNFAVLQIANFIRIKEHRDIDEYIELPPSSEWDVFLEKYYMIIQEDKQFIETGQQKVSYIVKQAKYLLQTLKRYLPDLTLDGMMNLWILKPHLGSCGCGILVCRTLKYILDMVQAKKESKYVIQKYIERPLLIYNTKFDIRQWFLVTCMPYLKVWMYKECYLRFSSQIFDLKKLNESIHLTNNSVQCKYKNCERNEKLPPDNMWHSDTFEQHLREMGYPFVWKNIIYRADIIKVTVDHARNPKASTGNFELIYTDNLTYAVPRTIEDIDTFLVEGKSYTVQAAKGDTQSMTNFTESELDRAERKTDMIERILHINPTKVKKDAKGTLEKILQIIHSEQMKPIEKRSKTIQVRNLLSEFVDIISNNEKTNKCRNLKL